MRKVFGDYLIQYQNSNLVRVNKEENTKAVVFLEDERSFWIKPVLQNYATFLDDSWNFYWICTDKNYDFLVKLTTEMGWSVGIRRIQDIIDDIPQQMSADTFNRIFKDPRWWESFKEETILTAQLDTILLQPFDNKWLEYDMVGAPCNFSTFNGGLCLRNRQKMLDCLANLDMQDMRFSPVAEDVFFTTALKHIGARLPSREEATAFSIENFPMNVEEYAARPFGMHGTNHYYIQDEIAAAIINGQAIKVQKPPHVLIVSPVYKWPPHPKFVESLQKCYSDPRMKISFHAVSGDAHIERARAMLLELYLRYEKPWDWLVMIDSDIEFNPDIIWGMINRGVDCIGAAYAFKSPEGTAKYQQPVIRPYHPEERTEDDLVRVRYLGGGFTLCSDALVKRLCEHYKDLEFFVNPDLMRGEGNGRTYALWNPILIEQESWDNGKKEMLSEDYSFCERIHAMGEKLWLDLRALIAHWDGDNCFKLATTTKGE